MRRSHFVLSTWNPDRIGRNPYAFNVDLMHSEAPVATFNFQAQLLFQCSPLRKWQFDSDIIRSKRSTGNRNTAQCTARCVLRKTHSANAFALYKFI